MITVDKAARMCPRCGGDSRVYRGAERKDGVFVRTRICQQCGAEFETLEVFSGYIRKTKIVVTEKSAVSDGQE